MAQMNQPYRDSTPIPIRIESRSNWGWRWGWMWRIALIVQGLPVAGLAHDFCQRNHEGICWAIAALAIIGALSGVIITVERPLGVWNESLPQSRAS